MTMPHFLNHTNHPVVKAFRHGENIYGRKLAEEHETLEEELAAETRRPAADWDRIKSLKVRKLRIAQQLEQLRQGA
jgi:hypothetical protein